MKHNWILYILAAILHLSARAQITFQKSYQYVGYEEAFAGYSTDDGGYLLASNTNAPSVSNIFLTKTDAVGNLLWSISFTDGAGAIRGYDAQQTTDKGCILTGQVYTPSSTNVFLLKADSIGNIQWTKIYSSSTLERGLSVQQTTDGGYCPVLKKLYTLRG